MAFRILHRTVSSFRSRTILVKQKKVKKNRTINKNVGLSSGWKQKTDKEEKMQSRILLGSLQIILKQKVNDTVLKPSKRIPCRASRTINKETRRLRLTERTSYIDYEDYVCYTNFCNQFLTSFELKLHKRTRWWQALTRSLRLHFGCRKKSYSNTSKKVRYLRMLWPKRFKRQSSHCRIY